MKQRIELQPSSEIPEGPGASPPTSSDPSSIIKREMVMQVGTTPSGHKITATATTPATAVALHHQLHKRNPATIASAGGLCKKQQTASPQKQNNQTVVQQQYYVNSTVHQPLFRSRPSNKNENNEQEARTLNQAIQQQQQQNVDNINGTPCVKSKSNVVDCSGGGGAASSSGSHSMLFDNDDEEEEEESENILDDSEIRPFIEYNSSQDRSSRLAMVHQNLVGKNYSGGKPVINDTGSTHISHVMKTTIMSGTRTSGYTAYNNANTNKNVKNNKIKMHYKNSDTIEHMLNSNNGMMDDFPEEHIDEIGPQTHREIAAQREEAFVNIHQRLINDKDAVMREARHSNNVSSLRPNANSDYFGNTEMDERSNIHLKNETKITKVRRTMAPSTSTSVQSLGLNVHGSYLRVGKPGNSVTLAPSKTPTLYETKKLSQPFLNSDHQKNSGHLHHHIYHYQNNESCSNNTSSASCSKKQQYTSTTAGTTTKKSLTTGTAENNRSRTALQSRLQKVSGSGSIQSQTFEHLSSHNHHQPAIMAASQRQNAQNYHQGRPQTLFVANNAYNNNQINTTVNDENQSFSVYSKTGYGSQGNLMQLQQQQVQLPHQMQQSGAASAATAAANQYMQMPSQANQRMSAPSTTSMKNAGSGGGGSVSQGTLLIGNTVRVNSNHRPSKAATASRDNSVASNNNNNQQQHYSMNQYGMITSSSQYQQRSSTNVNKTAEQSYRKSNNYLVVGGAPVAHQAPSMIQETTQKMNFKDMIYQGGGKQKPTGVQSQANLFHKEYGQDSHHPMLAHHGSSSPLKNGAKGRNHAASYSQHTRNNSSVVNQSIQIFKTLTANIFGSSKNVHEPQRQQQQCSINTKKQIISDQVNDKDDDALSSLYCETEHNAFDNKMHPTKIVEQNWVDSYKLAQLIDLQEKWLDEANSVQIFGGLHAHELDKAFVFNRCNSSTGFKSPSNAGQAAGSSRSISLINAQRTRTTIPRALSSQKFTNHSNAKSSIHQQIYHQLSGGTRGDDLVEHQSSNKQIEMQQHGSVNFINENDSQRSFGGSNASNESDRSEHFTKQFFMTQNKSAADQLGSIQKKGNIILDRIGKKIESREESRRLEQTLNSCEHQEVPQGAPQVQVGMEKQAPMLQKMLMNTTQGTADLCQTSESLKIPQIKLSLNQAQIPTIKANNNPNPKKDSVDPYLEKESSVVKRNASNNELLQNESGNNSHLLDPEDFVMSNTSMSMHTQSMVQGTETERGANILKDSGVTFHEDSTVLHDKEEDIDVRGITQLRHEILNRQVGSGTKQKLKLHEKKKEEFGEADTPLLRQDLTGDVRIQHHYRSNVSDEKDFKVSLQIDQQQDSDMPHLNKTTSIVVNEAFKNSKNNSNHQQTKNSTHPKHSGSINFKLLGQNHHNISKRSSGENSSRYSRDHNNNNVIASVKDSIDSITTAKKRINLSHMVPQPQILSQPKKYHPNVSSNHLIGGLNRSVVDQSLNQSTLTTIPVKKQHNRSNNTSAIAFINHDQMNSITQKVDRNKFSGNKDERLQQQNCTASGTNKNHTKAVRQKKSITQTQLIHGGNSSARKPQNSYKHLIHHQASQRGGHFNSQRQSCGVSTSMEFASNTSNQAIGGRIHSNNAIVTLKTKTAISSALHRGKSNTSSGKLLNTTLSSTNMQQKGGVQSSTTIPKTPQTSNKLKMLSAQKAKTTTSNSLIEEVSAVGAFTSKAIAHHSKKPSSNVTTAPMDNQQNESSLKVSTICCTPRRTTTAMTTTKATRANNDQKYKSSNAKGGVCSPKPSTNTLKHHQHQSSTASVTSPRAQVKAATTPSASVNLQIDRTTKSVTASNVNPSSAFNSVCIVASPQSNSENNDAVVKQSSQAISHQQQKQQMVLQPAIMTSNISPKQLLKSNATISFRQ